MTTIVELVGRTHDAATALGMDVSPQDVAFILSTFLEGMACSEPSRPGCDAGLRLIADAINSTKDEL